MSDESIRTPNSLVLVVKKVWQFKGMFLATLLTLVTVSILVKLGFWQMSRGIEKDQLENDLANRRNQSAIVFSEFESINNLMTNRNNVVDFVGQKVHLTVLPTNSALVYLLDNQTLNGQVGYVGYQILETSLNQNRILLLVDLGFVKASKQRDELPIIKVINTETDLVGRLYRKSKNPLSPELGIEDTRPARIQNLDIEALANTMTLPLYPMVLQPQNLESWPHEFIWVPANMSSDKHFGYSVQWFVMAIVLTVIMTTVGWKSYRKWNKR